MKAKREATIDDLYKVEGKAELVNGEIVEFPPDDIVTGFATDEIKISLKRYEKRTSNGYAFGSTLAFVVDLPHRKSFCPDTGFYIYIGPLTMKFPEGAPVFAVEVRSDDEYGPAAERAMAAKRADYFAAGTLVVWDVDLLSDDVVRVYRANDHERATVYRRGDVAEAEPAVPGWTMAVADLFPVQQAR